MIRHHFFDVEQSTIDVVDGKLSDIKNFDEIALEHWEYFGNKKPMFNKEYLAGLLVVIAKDIEKTVGYVFYVFFKSPYQNETWCQVDMFFLKPTHRGKGIGKEMFRLVEQMAKINGCKKLITSYNLKESLEMFYEKLGFNATHVAVAKDI
jgi:GNAT superfamily N-acetyltransferase